MIKVKTKRICPACGGCRFFIPRFSMMPQCRTCTHRANNPKDHQVKGPGQQRPREIRPFRYSTLKPHTLTLVQKYHFEGDRVRGHFLDRTTGRYSESIWVRLIGVEESIVEIPNPETGTSSFRAVVNMYLKDIEANQFVVLTVGAVSFKPLGQYLSKIGEHLQEKNPKSKRGVTGRKFLLFNDLRRNPAGLEFFHPLMRLRETRPTYPAEVKSIAVTQ